MQQNVADYPIDFTRLLYMQYQEMDILIGRADLKAQLVLAINAILIASDFNVALERMDVLFNNGLSNEERLLDVIALMVLLSLVSSLTFAILTIVPRRRVPSDGQNLFYFRTLTEISEDTYVQDYLDASLEDVKRGVMAQIHAKSFIVRRKFRTISLSVISLLMAVLFWSASLILPAVL